MGTEQEWQELGPGVHRRRYQPLDITVGVVEGDDGLLLIDTRRDPHEGAEIVRDVRARFARPLRWVVNTHAHHDHSYGNQCFGPGSELDLPIYGHRNLARHYAEYEAPRLAAFADGTLEEPTYDWRSVVLTPPTHEVGEPTVLDLGGRTVELLPLGPGHTYGDLVVHVPHARVWFMGDVVQQTHPPGFAIGSLPFDWADSVGAVVALMGPDDAVVPGHGDVVPPRYARQQLAQIRRVADAVRAAYERGLDEEEAVRSRTDWPFPERSVRRAVRAGYAQLGAAQG
jgi:glyoxylase-like metal-dependent hydrolase (beta-lactamase superfamily II)